MNIEFKLFDCPTDFDTRPFLEIDRKEFADISEDKLSDIEKELSYVCTVLANQTDKACEERGENAVVYTAPITLPECPSFKPLERLVEMCSNVGDGFKVYIGYKKLVNEYIIGGKRYFIGSKHYYCPQIRLINPCDEQGEFTMYEVLKTEINNDRFDIHVHSRMTVFKVLDV